MRAALLAGRWLYLLVLWLTLASAAGAGSLEIRAARAVVSVQALTTTANVTLPYHWDREHRSHPGSAQFDMAFTMPEVSLQQLGEPFGIYFARIGNTADVWLNGTLLARLGDTAIADADDFSKSPQYVSIPPQLLMQQNLLTIHLHADGGRRGGLSRVVLGPESEVLPLFLEGDLVHKRPAHIRASPLNWVTPDAAPILALHGTQDTYVAYEQSVWLLERLLGAGVPAELETIPGAGHGFKGADADRADTRAIAWLDRWLMSPAPK